MKRLLTIGLLSVAAVAMSQQQASAWIKFGVGAGANVSFQSGGNCIAWGALSGLPPHPHYGHGHGHPPFPLCHFKWPHVGFYGQPKPPAFKEYYFGAPAYYPGYYGDHYPAHFGH